MRRVLLSESPERRAEALARLAERLRRDGLADSAARCYRLLRKQYADRVCLDGKSGQDLCDALEPDEPTAVRLARRSPWPTGRVHVECGDPTPRKLVPLNGIIPGDCDKGLSSPLSMTYEPTSGKLVARDGFGAAGWEVPLVKQDGPADATAIDLGALVQYGGRVRSRGRLHVLQLVDRIAVVSVASGDPQLLWSVKTREVNKVRSTSQTGDGRKFLVLDGAPRVPLPQAGVLAGAEAQDFVVTESSVCFLVDGTLSAVDLLTGQRLWSRERVDPDSDLTGDDSVLLVSPPEGEALALSMLDGGDLGRRPAVDRDQRVLVRGRLAVLWSEEDGKRTLAVHDPYDNATLSAPAVLAGRENPTSRPRRSGGL